MLVVLLDWKIYNLTGTGQNPCYTNLAVLKEEVKKMDPFKILKFSHMTEKSVGLIDRENKIVFIVDRKANKKQIKEAFEKTFEVKVEKVNTEITFHGEKKAIIKLRPEFKARDIAVKLGMV